MAYTTKNGNTVQSVWRAYAKYQLTNTSNTQTKIDLITGMQSLAWGIDVTYLTGSATIGSNTKNASNLSFKSANGATVSKDLITHSATFTRTKSAQKKTLTAKIVNQTGYKNGTSTASVTVTVPAKPSYKVTFNANGGSGAPGAQTKWYGETLKLSTTKPTRTGYTFKGWGTSSTTSTVSYAAGANYTANAADTLYAIWTENTFTVTFNANGGSGAPGAQTKYYTKNLTLSTTKPTRTNYTFLGWATSSSATSAQYSPGGTFSTNANTTLYAVWELAYIPPTITGVDVDRCTSSGTLSDEGTYAKVVFTWQLDAANSGGLKSITIGYKRTSATSYTNTTVSASGTNGTVSKVIGSGALSTEYEYDILITVTDQKGNSTYPVALPAMSYIIDFSPQGGVGIGVPARNDKSLVVTVPMYLPNPMQGYSGQGNDSAWKYKILARGHDANTSGGSWGHIHIFGTMGGWTAVSKGPIDINIPTRLANDTTITVNSFFPGLFDSASARLVAIIGSDGYVYVVLGVSQYWAYSLFIDGQNIESIDSAWTSSMPVSGTTIFDTSIVQTTQFGGYPAKLEKLNGFYGFALPNKTRTDWLRTTYKGLIPYQAGQPSVSSLGSPTWQFENGYIQNLFSDRLTWDNTGGLKGRVWKQIWSGTWSSGSITVSEIPYYNVISVNIGGSDSSMILVRDLDNPNVFRGGMLYPYNAASGDGAIYIYCCDIDVSNTTMTLAKVYSVSLYFKTTYGANVISGNATTGVSITRINGLL